MSPVDTPVVEESLHDLISASRRVANRAVDIGANRIELFMVEMQEERERLLRSLYMGLAAGAFAILAGFAFTFGIVLVLWDRGAIGALFGLTAVYVAAAIFLRMRIMKLARDWPMFGGTMEQLRKDRECLAQGHQ